MCGKQIKPHGEAKNKVKRDFEEMRSKFEKRHVGNYELIYPCQDDQSTETQEYQKLLEVAREIWEQ